MIPEGAKIRPRQFTPDEFIYPSSDDMPKAESDLHRRTVNDLISRLAARYANDSTVYVSGGIRVYCEPWNPYDVCVPDCFVVLGVPKRDREAYLGWQEARMPNVVFEITSNYTVMDDRVKILAYENRWHVDEYFFFDPGREYLDPPLQGHCLKDGRYSQIQSKGGELTSEVLGLTLAVDGPRLILRDVKTGQALPNDEERAIAAEAENARLKAELDALRRRSSG